MYRPIYALHYSICELGKIPLGILGIAVDGDFVLVSSDIQTQSIPVALNSPLIDTLRV